MQDKVKMLLILAIFFSTWGTYKVGKAAYIAIAWEKTEGVVVDLPRHTWRCGKGSSECYTINVGFKVNEEFFTVDSDKIYPDPPEQFRNKKVTVYYSADDPWQAALGGTYGSTDGGIIFLLAGSVMFIIWIFAKPKK